MSGEHAGFETTDAQLRPILWLGAFLVVVLFVGLSVSAWVTNGFERSIVAEEPAGAMQAFRETPDGPLLQASPNREIEAHRAYEHEMLMRYGVIDPENGVFRIPITEAMRLTVEESR